MAVESSGKSRGNPRIYELVENAPQTGKSTVYAWPQLIDYLKVAAQPVQGPWPPHQQPRPDPTEDSMPVAVPDPHAPPRLAPAPPAVVAPAAPPAAAVDTVTEPPAQASTPDEPPIEDIRAAMPVDSTAGTDAATPPTAADTPAPPPAAEAHAGEASRRTQPRPSRL